MKELGILKESDSPWSSPMLARKNGDLWFCVDYQWLNNITKDCFLLPRINDILDVLTEAKWFSTLDLKSGYWQVDLHPSNKEKTAFCTGQGLWHFTVMPFGVCNAPAVFELVIKSFLWDLNYGICLVCLDYMITVIWTFQEAA